MSDIEKEIQAKGLTAPRITKQEIDELLGRVVYTFDVRPNGSTVTLAHAFLDGDFYLATGFSNCVSPENFNAELGKKIASANAKLAAEDKLWELEGYALRKRLAAAAYIEAAVMRIEATIIVEGESPEKFRERIAGRVADIAKVTFELAGGCCNCQEGGAA